MRRGILRPQGLFIFLALFWAWGVAWSATTYDKGLLWEVTNPQGRTSHILGTIHSSDPRVLALAPPVQASFDSAGHFVMEFIPDAGSIGLLQTKMLYPEGQQLKDALPETLYGRSIEAMARRGVPELVTARMRPWTVLVTLNMPPDSGNMILDMMLYQNAAMAGKAMTGLETAEEQIAVLADWPQEKIIQWLEDTITHQAEIEALQVRLLEAWLDRDLARLQTISEEMEFGDAEDYEAFTERLVDERNQRMVRRMRPALDEGGAFVAIGALHLPGEKGVLNLLTQKGYRITVVY